MTWRKLWCDVHLGLALSFGLLLSVIGLTGSLNVYFFEIDEWLNPGLLVKPAASGPRPLDDVIGALSARFLGIERRQRVVREQLAEVHLLREPGIGRARRGFCRLGESGIGARCGARSVGRVGLRHGSRSEEWAAENYPEGRVQSQFILLSFQ